MTRKSTSSTATQAAGDTGSQTPVETPADQSPPPAPDTSEPPPAAPEWPQSGGSFIRLPDGSLVPAQPAEQTED
jgi:hypothetical protein